jgi:hypothetical protein
VVDHFRSVHTWADHIPDDCSPPDTGPYDTLGLLTPGQVEDMRADQEARARLAGKLPAKRWHYDQQTVLMPLRVRTRGQNTTFKRGQTIAERWC